MLLVAVLWRIVVVGVADLEEFSPGPSEPESEPWSGYLVEMVRSGRKSLNTKKKGGGGGGGWAKED